jgi:hypothetical protein
MIFRLIRYIKRFIRRMRGATMTKAELLERIAADLGTANDADQRRRLAVVEREPGAWCVAYSGPRYAGAWEPEQPPAAWVALDWLTAAPGPSEPVCWPSLDLAAAEASAIRRAVLDAAPGAGLLVVVTEQPRVVVV